MPITYNIVPILLTDPPSYTARPTSKHILGYDDVAEEINTHNPTISVATAKSVLKALRSEVLHQLVSGNSINLEGFVSFVVSMPVHLENPTDPLPSDPLNVKAKPSRTLKTEIRQEATYSRAAYIEKAPSVISATDSNTNIQNYVRDNSGLRINGSNVGFDPTDANQGVFLLSQAGNNIQQTNVALNDPSQIIIIPLVDAAVGPAGAASVEQILSIVSKYTENGQLRTGTFSKILRGTNVITGTNLHLFVTGSGTYGPYSVGSYTGVDQTIRLISKIRPDNVLVVSAATLLGEPGQEYDVLPSTTEINLTDFGDLAINLEDYDLIYSTTLAYGRFVQEVVSLTSLT